MIVFFLIIGAIVIPEMFYFYKCIVRILRTWGIEANKWTKIGIGVGVSVLGVFCLDVSSIIALASLHLACLALLVQLVNFIIKKCAKKRYTQSFGVWKKIYGSGVIPILLTVAIIVGGYVNLHSVVRTNYTVTTDKPIRAEGYRVALIADVHYGVSLDREELLEKCAEISACNVDTVILCGDIIDDGTGVDGMREVFAALGTIKSRYGIFYVYGNHDRNMMSLGYGFTDQELVETIERNGITVLQDEIFAVTEDLVLVGREDKSASRNGTERKTIATLLAATDPNDFVLTLDHQPVEYAANGAAGTDLLLSGHTHGGQIWPLNFINTLVSANDAVYGRTEIDSNTQAIVTSGFAGWSYPIKTAAPSEYVIVEILPK